jgi:hypothetical protein
MAAANELPTLDIGDFKLPVGRSRLLGAREPRRPDAQQESFLEALDAIDDSFEECKFDDGTPYFHAKKAAVAEVCAERGIAFTHKSTNRNPSAANSSLYLCGGGLKVECFSSDTETDWAQGDNRRRYCYINLKEKPKSTREVFNLDQFLEHKIDIEFLIDRYLVKGLTMLCAGPQKACKTTMMLYMGLCLALGVLFLGSRVTKSRVLVLTGESGLPTLQETVKRILATMNTKYDPDFFHISSWLPKLGESLEELGELLQELRIDVLIVDPAYLCMDGTDAGNMFVMGPQLKNLADLCTTLGVTPIIATHTTKGAGKENRPLELPDIAWSGFAEFARQWFLISRRTAFDTTTGKHELYLNVGSSAWGGDSYNLNINEGLFPNRIFEASIVSSREANAVNAQAEYESDCKKVLSLFADGKPRCKTPLREHSGVNKARFDEVNFARMLDEGLLVEVGRYQGHPKYFPHVTQLNQ